MIYKKTLYVTKHMKYLQNKYMFISFIIVILNYVYYYVYFYYYCSITFKSIFPEII